MRSSFIGTWPGHERSRRPASAWWALLAVAGVLLLVAPTAAASDSTDPRLSATLVGSLEAGATGRLAVRWDGPAGALLDLWVDLDGDGVAASHELLAEGRPLTPGIEVVSFDLPPGVPVVPEPKIWVRARTGGWCDTAATLAGAAAAEDGDLCAWQPGFHVAGLNGEVYAMTVFDDGSGPALYVAGEFTVAGDQAVSNIVRWDGTAWLALGGGGDAGVDDRVVALTVFDDGSGPALFVGGWFTTAGGLTVNRIARWDGTSWSGLSGPSGTGVGKQTGGFGPVIEALAVFDDGSGPALYAGGDFDSAGGVTANNISRWDGNQWSALGAGAGGQYSQVSALAAFDDGSGPALYVGGEFDTAGGVTVNDIARWDGSTWSGLDGGVQSGEGVYALTVFDDGSGLALYAGGGFTWMSGVLVNAVAKWNGSAWSALSGGMRGPVDAFAVFDDGAGSALYASGGFDLAGGVTVNGIARWDGSEWSALGTGVEGPYFRVSTLAVYDDGFGPALYAGGRFNTAGGVPVTSIAQWDGSAWSAVSGSSGMGVYSGVGGLAVFDDGTGPALYAGGGFETAGGLTVNDIARWDGTNWSALSGPSGTGMGGSTNTWVGPLTVFDDGFGPALYAGGRFETAGGVTVNNIARWDGSAWSALAGPSSAGVNGSVEAIAAFDDGTGPALYAGGRFTTAGGVPVNHIARWDGSGWSDVGGGVAGDYPIVRALALFDDGAGSALYAGGEFWSAGGVTAYNIARWDGFLWSNLAGGVYSQTVQASVEGLGVFDDGMGPNLYVGGGFETAGGFMVNNIARWDGSAWSGLSGPSGTGVSGSVDALTVYDEGSGPVLFAGGFFETAGGVTVNAVARWDGSAWRALSGSSATGVDGWVSALAVYDDGSGPALFTGGEFLSAGGLPSGNIAAWKCPAGLIFADDFEEGTATAWSHTVP